MSSLSNSKSVPNNATEVFVVEYHSESGHLPNPEIVAVFSDRKRALDWARCEDISEWYGDAAVLSDDDKTDFEYPCMLVRKFVLDDTAKIDAKAALCKQEYAEKKKRSAQDEKPAKKIKKKNKKEKE